jgi:hypothetical protein
MKKLAKHVLISIAVFSVIVRAQNATSPTVKHVVIRAGRLLDVKTGNTHQSGDRHRR